MSSIDTYSQPAGRSRRLNPFAFPPDTSLRFVLLIISIVSASLFAYNIGASLAYYVLFGTSAPNQVLASWMGGGVTLLLGVAALIYWTFPAWRIRRDQLEPLSAEDTPEIVSYLDDLCREAGLSRHPIFMLNPLNPVANGLAFGRFGQYYVLLNGGLITKFYTDRPAFRAIVLHELAHLRNADVNKTYFTIAIWWAFVIAALPLLAINLLVNSFPWDLNFAIGWRVIALAILVFLIRNGVLRAREVYADVRASAWDGLVGALRRVLEALPHGRSKHWWRTALRVHPDPGKRRQALDDTKALFRLGAWDALATGIVATLAFPNLANLLLLFTGNIFGSMLAAGLITFTFAAGVVGAGAWRAAFVALARGEAPRGVGGLGLALGSGLIVGQFLSFQSVSFSASTHLDPQLPLFNFAHWIQRYLDGSLHQSSTQQAFFASVAWNVILLVALFFFARWIAAGASVWLKVVATGRALRTVYWISFVIAGGFLTMVSALLLAVSSVSGSIFSPQGFFYSIPLQILMGPFLDPSFIILDLALVSLWAFPLAAWFWRERVASASAPSWALLDSSSEQLTLPQQAPLRLGTAMRAALVGSLVFCALLLIAWIGWRQWVPEERSTILVLRWFLPGQVAVAALAQAGVAMVVTKRVRGLGSIHGLYAAFVAGCLMAVEILLLNLLFGGTINLDFALQIFSMVVTGGVLLALPALLGVSVLEWWLRRSEALST